MNKSPKYKIAVSGFPSYGAYLKHVERIAYAHNSTLKWNASMARSRAIRMGNEQRDTVDVYRIYHYLLLEILF